MSVPHDLRAITQSCVDDLAWIERVLRTAGDIEWVSDAAGLYVLRLADASRAVAGLQRRAAAAERALARLAAAT